MDARELSEQLARQADSVAARLLPNGRKENREWVAGSVHGEKGKSLKVCLDGPKVGVWKDFATDEGGDLLDLWCQTKGISLSEAMKEAADFLGIRAANIARPAKQKEYQKPDAFPRKKSDSTVNYLTKERGLTLATLKAFQVESVADVDFPRDKVRSDAYFLPYHLEKDGLVHWKLIGLKRKDGNKKLVRTSAETKPCLFGWQAMDAKARSLVITEGEIDAMTVYQWGFPALSVPFGAGNHQWVEEEWERLNRFDTIYLCFDNDESGHKGKTELIQRLGIHRTRFIDLPGKDPNTLLTDGMTKEGFACLLDDAQSLDPEELKTARHYLDKVIDAFYPSSNSVQGFEMPWVDTKNRLRIRPAELSIWTGINGHGKSELLGHILLDLIRQGERVCIASMEIQPRTLLKRLVRQASTMREPSARYIETVIDWFGDRLWLFDVVGTAKWERILEVFEYARRRYGITQFVIDSLMKCGIPEDDYRMQKQFTEALADFKNRLDCHVHLVAHSRKGEDEHKPVGKLDVKGTGAITDLADNCFSVWRNKKKEEYVETGACPPDISAQPDCILRCDKQRNGEWEGKVPLWFDRDSHQYLPEPTVSPKRYVSFSVLGAISAKTS